MSVDAIQQVIEAEKKAEMLLQETTALIEEKEKRSQEAIEAFHDTLRVQEKQAQQELLEQQAAELAQLKAPLIEKTAGEIATLQQVSPEIRRKAINLILEAVVN